MKYHIWKPLDQLKGPCQLERFADDWEGLHLILFEVESKSYLRLTFQGSSHGVRFTDRRGNIHLQERGVKDDWSFYQVANSDFEAWIHQASSGILQSSKENVLHFAICTLSEIIDILNSEPPTCARLPEHRNISSEGKTNESH